MPWRPNIKFGGNDFEFGLWIFNFSNRISHGGFFPHGIQTIKTIYKFWWIPFLVIKEIPFVVQRKQKSHQLPFPVWSNRQYKQLLFIRKMWMFDFSGTFCCGNWSANPQSELETLKKMGLMQTGNGFGNTISNKKEMTSDFFYYFIIIYHFFKNRYMEWASRDGLSGAQYPCYSTSIIVQHLCFRSRHPKRKEPLNHNYILFFHFPFSFRFFVSTCQKQNKSIFMENSVFLTFFYC